MARNQGPGGPARRSSGGASSRRTRWGRRHRPAVAPGSPAPGPSAGRDPDLDLITCLLSDERSAPALGVSRVTGPAPP